MRGKNGVKFFSVILLIAVLTYLAAFGLEVFDWGKIKGASDIRTGIDIRGGVYAVLYPILEGNAKASEKDLDTAKAIINKRLDNKGVLDRTVTIEKVNGRIIVKIPWKAGEVNFNPQDTINDIGRTALLTFQEVDESKTDGKGGYLPTGKIVIQGTEIADAKVGTNTQTGEIVVDFELSSEGATKFAEATGRLVGKKIAIFMDDTEISHPTVNTAITGGSGYIEGNFTAEEAGKLAAEIRSGALPFKLEARQVDSISPTLGESALSTSVDAGIVAFILVCLFMLAYYRLPGILANVALLCHTVIQLLVISWLGITLTLPGIAGVILTIGMGVDANVIIFERIKEELRNGKTLRAAIDVGFKRAFTAILDANMTTLISAVVLYIFGTGSIQGFAITLGLGVFLSFFTAVTITRIMLKSVADVNIAKHHWLYGA